MLQCKLLSVNHFNKFIFSKYRKLKKNFFPVYTMTLFICTWIHSQYICKSKLLQETSTNTSANPNSYKKHQHENITSSKWLLHSNISEYSLKINVMQHLLFCLPLKCLVSPQLHSGKVQMPCKITRVPRQRPDSIFSMLIAYLSMTKNDYKIDSVKSTNS